MTTARRLHYTYAEYLDALAMSELKLEFHDGDIFAMAGGTPERGMLAASVIALLGQQLAAPCRIMTSDVKVRVLATGLSTFPDLSVVCGELERAADDPNSITNPVVLVEVLSRSTEDYDRGEKLIHYKQIPSLRYVLLVAHDTHLVTLVARDEEGAWVAREHRDGDTLRLERPAVQLAVTDIYRPLAAL
ncbi:MAG: hypothetical protein JWP97_4055 [Labilithrix sp.]|nr:hypothetical protein [Labilithrix sp.]